MFYITINNYFRRCQMISISPSVNNSIDFKSNKTTEKTQNKTTSSTISNNSTKNIAIPTLAMLMYMNALSTPIQAETKDDISDTYILPCDVWFEKNPFSTIEDESWYFRYKY